MRNFRFSSVLLICFLIATAAFGQSGKGVIEGAVKDPAGEVLPGAKIEMKPHLRPITTNVQGEFTITDVPAGTYSLTVTYVGFAPYTGSITVTAGQSTHLDAKLQVASASDNVEVTADRPRGEAEAINRTLAAENILQVLPADVIVSLPNANVADALGRMASTIPTFCRAHPCASHSTRTLICGWSTDAGWRGPIRRTFRPQSASRH